MARLRVRAKTNETWIDICTNDFFIRNSSNMAWLRLQPDGFLAVRSGDNRYWYAVTCTDAEETCHEESEDDNFELCPE